MQPLNQASSHVYCEPDRSRKLLLKRRELDKLIGAAEREGYSIVATAMYWKGPGPSWKYTWPKVRSLTTNATQ